jgi:hypothetical protein
MDSKTGRKTIYGEPMKTRQIRAPDFIWRGFLSIGGSSWFRDAVLAEMKKRDIKLRKGKK